MKSGMKRWLRSILIVILLAAGGFILFSTIVYEKDYPEFSSYSAKKTGLKALYLLAGKMGYQTGRYHYPFLFLKENPVMVAYRPADSLFNEEKEQESLTAWLFRGNTLVLIPDEQTLNRLWIFDMISERKKWHEVVRIGDITVTWYGLEQGTVCVLDSSESFLNANISGSDASVAFIRVLERISNPKVFFNEYYRFLQKPAPGVWELIGYPGQLAAIQLLLVFLLAAARGWKPFGRVRNEREWTKRPENEVLKALSGLYVRRKAYSLVLANYYGYFTQKYGRLLNSPGPSREKALRILAACRGFIESGTGSRKELWNLVHQLEKAEDQIKGR